MGVDDRGPAIVEKIRDQEVYRLERNRWVVVSTHGDDDLVRAAPFDAVELEIARWWLEG